jgi:hypothetical protein
MNPVNQVLDLSFIEVKTISLLLLGFINYPCDFCAKTDYILALCICYPQDIIVYLVLSVAGLLYLKF